MIAKALQPSLMIAFGLMLKFHFSLSAPAIHQRYVPNHHQTTTGRVCIPYLFH
jgi:hypothetical protein